MITDNDAGKYVKKKDSNISKSKVKSKHKHIYNNYLLICNGYPHLGSCCNICGKIGNIALFESRKENGVNRALTKDEIYARHKDLEHIIIGSVWQKYVSVIGENNG